MKSNDLRPSPFSLHADSPIPAALVDDAMIFVAATLASARNRYNVEFDQLCGWGANIAATELAIRRHFDNDRLQLVKQKRVEQYLTEDGDDYIDVDVDFWIVVPNDSLFEWWNEQVEPNSSDYEWSEIKTKNDWCKHFGISLSTLGRRIKKRQLIVEELNGQNIRIRLDTLNRFPGKK